MIGSTAVDVSRVSGPRPRARGQGRDHEPDPALLAGNDPRGLPADLDLAPDAARLVRLLADPNRRQIFLLLMLGEVCNCELANALQLPQNLVSHHLRQLREAGFVQEHRDPQDGRWIHYTVDAEALSSAWGGLSAALRPKSTGARLPACHARGKTDGDRVVRATACGHAAPMPGPA